VGLLEHLPQTEREVQVGHLERLRQVGQVVRLQQVERLELLAVVQHLGLLVQAVFKVTDTPQLHRQHLHWVMQEL
jgi:hypothetical protein